MLPYAFFSFTLTRGIDFNKYVFAISVLQQGDRLGNYRQRDASKKFEPASFNLILMNDKGELINARFGSSFCFSLLNQKDSMLQPGKYILMVDPLWNATSANDDLYK